MERDYVYTDIKTFVLYPYLYFCLVSIANLKGELTLFELGQTAEISLGGIE